MPLHNISMMDIYDSTAYSYYLHACTPGLGIDFEGEHTMFIYCSVVT